MMMMMMMIQFISRTKTGYISCTHYEFCAFYEAYYKFCKTAYFTRHKQGPKLNENERNTGRFTTQISENGMNG